MTAIHDDSPAAGRLRLSVLDQSPISQGSTGADALANTLDLARLSERLGYHRYWVAEHHGGPMLASASPEVLIGAIADATERLRVGSGGVMLPHYSPLKVAETFSILAALHPGRIDLGIGRAPGTDQVTMLALQRDRSRPSPDDFAQQLAELLAYLDDTMPANHPFARLAALPGGDERPAPWLLGSSQQSALWAAELGLPYSFADFINPAGAPIAQLYRDRFVDSGALPAPRVAVGVWAICAETGEQAQRLAASSRMAMSMLRQGRLIAVPPVEEALRYIERRDAEREQGPAPGADGAALAPPPRERRRRMILGTPATVREGIEEVARDYGAEEAIVVTITHDHAERRRSYELIADAFGLGGAAPSAAGAAPAP